jgi:hypothetical protein
MADVITFVGSNYYHVMLCNTEIPLDIFFFLVIFSKQVLLYTDNTRSV